MRTLVHRPRRLRRSAALRNLVRETQLSVHDFVLPLFVSEKLDERRAISSMPGVFQIPLKQVADEGRRAQDVGLQAVLSPAAFIGDLLQGYQIGRAHV